MSARDWLHLVVLLQLPGALFGWLAARSVYRRQRPRRADVTRDMPTVGFVDETPGGPA